MATPGEAFGRLPRGDRAVLLSALAVLILAGWAYLFYQDWAMRHMDVVDMAMPSMQRWGAADLALVFLMWAIMIDGHYARHLLMNMVVVIDSILGTPIFLPFRSCKDFSGESFCTSTDGW